MPNFSWRLVVGAIASAAMIASTATTWAEDTKVSIAYLLADSMLPALYAQDRGYFADEGLEPDLITVQGGPAVVAALASGEADVGYAAPVPPINARLSGVPVKMFLQIGQEGGAAGAKSAVWLVASKASGIKSIADVKGRRIAFNANGGLCELMWRDHLASAGLSIKDVEVVILPFPAQEAAMEQGSIEAACTFNPFYLSMVANPKVGAEIIASGVLADLTQPLVTDVLFATDAWLDDNGGTAVKLAKVMDRARKELLGDRALLESAAVRFLELTPEAAKGFELPSLDQDSMVLTDAQIQRLLDAMVKNDMHPGPLDAADFVAEVKY